MKQSYRLFSRYILAFAAVIGCSAILTACSSGSGGRDEEDFLAEVRKKASESDARITEVHDGDYTFSGTEQDTSRQPFIEFETDYFKLGTVPNDKITFHRLKVYNRGEAPLVIDKVHTECACTVGQMVESKTVPPNGEGEFAVRFDPYKVNGFESEKVLTIYNNAPNAPKFQLPVHANIEPELIIEPRELDFGTARYGEEITKTVRVRINDDEPIKVVEARPLTQPSPFEYELRELPSDEWTDPNKPEYEVAITLHAHDNIRPGLLRELYILDNSSQRVPEARAIARAEIIMTEEAAAGQASAPMPSADAEDAEDLQLDPTEQTEIVEDSPAS